MATNGFDETAALELEQEGKQFQAIVILSVDTWTQEHCATASRHLGEVSHFLAKVNDIFQPEQERRFKAHREFTSWRKRVEEPARRLETELKNASGRWLRMERARVEQEQQRLEAEARKAADDATLAKAEELQQAGFGAESIDLALSEPIQPETVAAPEIVKVAGVTTREYWHADITDMGAFLEYVAGRSEYWNLVEVKQGMLNKLASVQQRALKIPGVQVKKTDKPVKSK